jgi:NAD-dependent dihydropyrimidine dehydrogenase PreA subunit
MSVLINFKICDNAKECGGVAVCKSGAISWDERKKTLVIDNSKCTACGLCEKACPVEAIKVAKTDEEYQKLKAEIEEDPRKVSDLFVDRYGASPINPSFVVKEKDFPVEIEGYSRLAVAELFNDESIMCLLRSIPIGELFEGKTMKYGKVKVENENLLQKYSIKVLPALLFFENGKFLGKIEGDYRMDRKKELMDLIKSTLS